MKLKTLRIENLRAFCDETIPFDDYTCFVGANGSGKSTVLTALNIFFRENSNAATNLLKLEREDFHRGDISKPVRITLTFTELSAEAQKDFGAYYRHEQLVVSAVARWNDASQCAEVTQVGERLGIRAFAEFYEAIAAKKKKPELEGIFNRLAAKFKMEGAKYGSLANAQSTLQAFEQDNLDECETIPSPTEFYGYTGGEHLLEKYVQWVYVPAVKDAADEQDEGRGSCLSRLLERAVADRLSFDADLPALRGRVCEEYDRILQSNQNHLDGLSTSLGKRLREWAHPDTRMMVQFQSSEKSVVLTRPVARITAGEGIFDGAIARFGHGLQRCFLLAILQELALASGGAGPRLLLGVEEPELYQHPPQARHLANVLIELASHNAQVAVSTHSPLFVSGMYFENLRIIRRRAGTHDACAKWTDVEALTNTLNAARGHAADRPAATIAKLNQILQPALNEMFFAPFVVFVEGLEDVAYITSYITLTGRLEEFRRSGCHIVPCHGKDSMVQPIAIARQVEIPCFVIFDSDTTVTKQEWLEANRRDNTAILRVLGHPSEPALPTSTLWKDDLVVWGSDIGEAVAADLADGEWGRLREGAKATHKLHAKGDMTKNGLLIGYTLAEALGQGKQFPTLERLINAVLRRACQARESVEEHIVLAKAS